MFQVGHPSYSGANAPTHHATYAQALADLLKRGVRLAEAHRALQSALQGNTALARRNHKRDGVEVTASAQAQVAHRERAWTAPVRAHVMRVRREIAQHRSFFQC